MQVVAAQEAFDHLLAFLDVLSPAFFLEPGADLGLGAARLDDVQPVTGRALVRVRRTENLDDLTGADLVVQRDDLAVDLGAVHVVTDLGVDGVREVDDRGAHRDVDDVALRCEDEDVVRHEVGLDGLDDLFDVVGIFLVFEQLADPGKAFLELRGALDAHLVLPVGRDAVLRRVVHLPGADLHFEGNALFRDDRRVERLVHVGLGVGNIVFESPGERMVHVVDDAETVVAVRHRVDDDADGIDIVDLVEGVAADEHLPVNAVDALLPSADLRFRNELLDAFADFFHRVGDERRVDLIVVREQVFDGVVAVGVQVADGQVLELFFDGTDPEPVRDGRVDLESLEGLLLLLLFPHVFERPHVVQTVGELDDDDADVLGHGDEHLADVLRLLLLVSRQRDFTEFGDAADELGDLIAKGRGKVFEGNVGVLDRVVQDGGDDGLVVHAEVKEDARDCDRVHDVGLTGITALVFMGLRREVVSLHYHVLFFLRVGVRHQFAELIEPVIVFDCLCADIHYDHLFV